MATFDAILQKMRPGAEYSNVDGTLAGVIWAGGVALPTQEEFDAAEAALAVPQTVRAGDFVTALHELDWINDVKAAVAAAGGLAEDLWMHASTFERGHSLVAQIGTAIGKTSAELDQLFVRAAEIGRESQ